MNQGTEQSTVTPIGERPQDHLLMWRSYVEVQRGLLPNTIKLYVKVLSDVERECGPLLEQTFLSLSTWINSRGGSSSSVANRISALKSFYRYMVRSGVRLDDPTSALEAPRRHKGVPKPVDDLPSKLDALDELDRRVEMWGTGRKVGESRAMAVLLYETGLRIHEAHALNVPMPCPDAITIIGKGHKEARILLTAQARKALNFLGGKWPIGIRATQRRFEKVGMHPHQLRHSLGCAMAASGADLGEIQDTLRHSSPATTRGYSAYSDERLRAAQARRARKGL